MLLEPKEAHDDNNNVDEAEVRQDRDKVDVELLVEVEEFDVNAATCQQTPMLANHASETANLRIEARLG